jgi:DNA-binding NarL/FixJ family response regulator
MQFNVSRRNMQPDQEVAMLTHRDPVLFQPELTLNRDTIDQSECVSISIVSNSRLLREGLASLLQPYLSMTVVGSYSGETAMPTFPDPGPNSHVVLIDSGLGKECAVAWTTFWRGQHPPAHVIILELGNDFETITACIEAGAGGYTERGVPVSQVAEAVRMVRRGAAHCSPELAGHIFARLAQVRARMGESVRLKIPLTTRELEVINSLAAGMTNLQIAESLVIEVSTVKHHVHNILDKLQLRSRWDAVEFACEHGWIEIKE